MVSKKVSFQNSRGMRLAGILDKPNEIGSKLPAIDEGVKISHKTSELEYSQITPYIFIGTNACCQTHFDEDLLKRKIEADISLEYERIDTPWGVKYFLWVPTENHTAPTENQLALGAKFLKQLVDNRIKTYVHCEHGHGRAPTLVAAYFILTGKSLEESVSIIKKRRPSIHLEKVQIKALKNFEKMVKNGKI